MGEQGYVIALNDGNGSWLYADVLADGTLRFIRRDPSRRVAARIFPNRAAAESERASLLYAGRLSGATSVQSYADAE